MKIRSNRYQLKDREGEQRTVRKFLLWPRRFRTGNWRWLEYADIVEEIVAVDIGGHFEWGKYKWVWVEQYFADEPETAEA